MHTTVSHLPSQHKRHRRRALKSIQDVSTHAEKQQVIEDYLYLKISPALSAAENAEVLQRKSNKLARQLDPIEAEQMLACSAYYIKHMKGLTRQKTLVVSGNTAAKVARQTEQADELSDAIGIVANHMQKDFQPEQGPQARLRTLAGARNDVEAAFAFPKRAGWDSALDSFMHSKASQTPVYGPGHSMLMAQQLNNADKANAELLADQYFYNKVVGTWSITANQGHIENELQALLPQLGKEGLRQCVQGRAQFYIRHMCDICDIKLGQQQWDWQSKCSDSSHSSNDQWRLVMHSAQSQHFATVLDREL